MFEILWFVLISSIVLLIVIPMIYLIDGIVTEQEHYSAIATIVVCILLFCISAYNISLYQDSGHREIKTFYLENDTAKHLYYMDGDKPFCISELGDPLPGVKVGFKILKHPVFGEFTCVQPEFYTE
jgi:hypothetical protein